MLPWLILFLFIWSIIPTMPLLGSIGHFSLLLAFFLAWVAFMSAKVIKVIILARIKRKMRRKKHRHDAQLHVKLAFSNYQSQHFHHRASRTPPFPSCSWYKTLPRSQRPLFPSRSRFHERIHLLTLVCLSSILESGTHRSPRTSP